MKYETQAIPTRDLRLQFAEGLSPSAMGGLPASVLRSWERTRSAGLKPEDRVLFSPSASRVHRRHVDEQYRDLIRCAEPEMERLLHSLASPNWVALLADSSGTIVFSLGNQRTHLRELRELDIGRNLDEGAMGTNAPACALNEGTGALVIGQEHYLDELQHYSCAAAPIRAPSGELLGVLDITGWQVPQEPSMLERVVTFARAIENRLLAELVDVAILSLHPDHRLLGTPMQGLLAVTVDGELVAANSVASTLLSLAPGKWRGMTLDALAHSTELPLLARQRQPSTTPRLVRLRCGSRLYVGWTSAGSVRPRVASKAPGASSAGTGAVMADPQVRRAFERAQRVARQGIAVLIQGETGTGKEEFAKALHRACRPAGPFVAINCAAMPETLIEAELFGYVEGAFTGARKGGATGKLAQADGGTLLLDEIGDMPLALQTRLLRVLQEREFVPVGCNRAIAVDMMIVSATHRDLQAGIAAGSFREDLFYRLAGYELRLPKLREREDLQLLVQEILRGIDPAASLSEEAMTTLQACDWPGNVRQLAQVLKTAAALCETEDRVIRPEDFPERFRAEAVREEFDADRTDSETLEQVEQRAIAEALARCDGNVSAAARALGISRTTLYARMGKPATPA